MGEGATMSGAATAPDAFQLSTPELTQVCEQRPGWVAATSGLTPTPDGGTGRGAHRGAAQVHPGGSERLQDY